MSKIIYRHRIEKQILEHVYAANGAVYKDYAGILGDPEPIPFLLSAVNPYKVAYQGSAYFDTVSYFSLDFNDYLDYATSPLTPQTINLDQFLDGNIYYYDALPNTFDEGILDSEEGEFSVVGVGICKNKSVLTICMSYRKFDQVGNMKNKQQSWHEEFVYLMLYQNTSDKEIDFKQRILVGGVVKKMGLLEFLWAIFKPKRAHHREYFHSLLRRPPISA